MATQTLGDGGPWRIFDGNTDRVIGRWSTYDLAAVHRDEHQAMDPEADLAIENEEDDYPF